MDYSITIEPRNEKEYSLLMAMFEKMNIRINKKSAKALLRPWTPASVEELREELDVAVQQSHMGLGISNEDVKKRTLSTWV